VAPTFASIHASWPTSRAWTILRDALITARGTRAGSQAARRPMLATRNHRAAVSRFNAPVRSTAIVGGSLPITVSMIRPA